MYNNSLLNQMDGLFEGRDKGGEQTNQRFRFLVAAFFVARNMDI